MKLVWDERKRLANIAKHGMDFADLDYDFFEAAVVTDTKMSRFIAVGSISNHITTVVFSLLGSEGISVISMRTANRQERTLLDAKG